MNDFTKLGALLAACKAEVALEMAKDYCGVLCDVPELPENVRNQCKHLHEACCTAVGIIGGIAGRIDAEVVEPEEQPEELA